MLCRVVSTRVVWPLAAHQFAESLRVIQHRRGHGLTVEERGRGALSVLVFENLVALGRPRLVAALPDGGRVLAVGQRVRVYPSSSDAWCSTSFERVGGTSAPWQWEPVWEQIREQTAVKPTGN